jgi:hypothetical protein
MWPMIAPVAHDCRADDGAALRVAFTAEAFVVADDRSRDGAGDAADDRALASLVALGSDVREGRRHDERCDEHGCDESLHDRVSLSLPAPVSSQPPCHVVNKYGRK